MTSHTVLHRTISFTADAKLAPPSDSTMSSGKTGRRRRSSSIIYQEPPETVEQISDQAVNPNLNSQWVNAKGGHGSCTKSAQSRAWLTMSRCMDYSPRHNTWSQDILRHYSWYDPGDLLDPGQHHLHDRLLPDVPLGERCTF